MFNDLKNNLVWKEGKGIIFIILIFSVLSFYVLKVLLFFILFFFMFCLYFFRNPNRFCKEYENDKTILISPADGKVVDVASGSFDGFNKKISIFLSPVDVHVNWLPYNGLIKGVNYRPGKFAVAYAPKSSDINERNDIIIECDNGKEILVRQIAGIVARRICCWTKAGDKAVAGQKFGMIRFGSRVDVLLPLNVDICVTVGDRVKGGESILGRWL